MNCMDAQYIESVCNALVEAVVIADAEKNLLYANASARYYLGEDPQILGLDLWIERQQLLDPKTKAAITPLDHPMAHVLRGREVNERKVFIRNLTYPSGLFLAVNGKPIKSGGRTVGGIVSFRSLSTELQMGQAMTDEQAFYRHILDLMPGVVMIKDLENHFLFGNRALYELFKVKSFSGLRCEDLLDKSGAEQVRARDELVLLTLKAQTFEEIIYQDDGSRTVLHTVRFPYYNVSGEVSGICVVGRDVTKELQALAALDKERERGAHVSKLAAIGVLAAEIAHEIKNPLAVIHTLSEVIKSALSEETIDRPLVTQKIRVLNETIHRIDKVASSLNSISRDATNDPPKRFRVGDLLEEIKALSSFRTKNLNMEIECRAIKCGGAEVMANRIQIYEVLLNLVVNALDAVERVSDPVIRITYEVDGENVVVRIYDNGPGVAQDLREQIFEPFFTTKESGKGSGLGLSISKRIVEQHEGQLWYEGSVDGHCFVVRLPMAPEDQGISLH